MQFCSRQRLLGLVCRSLTSRRPALMGLWAKRSSRPHASMGQRPSRFHVSMDPDGGWLHKLGATTLGKSNLAHMWLAFPLHAATPLVNVNARGTSTNTERSVMWQCRCGIRRRPEPILTMPSPSQWPTVKFPENAAAILVNQAPGAPSGGNPRKRDPRFGERLACGWEMAVEGVPSREQANLAKCPVPHRA